VAGVDFPLGLPKAPFGRRNTRLATFVQPFHEVAHLCLKALDRLSWSGVSGDGQVVMVRFNSFNVEVVPAFQLQNGQYYIFDTNNGGRWKTTDPIAEQATIDASHTAYNNNTKTLVRMMKVWSSLKTKLTRKRERVSSRDIVPPLKHGILCGAGGRGAAPAGASAARRHGRVRG
jgi:Second Messenger Oligonucleotide or Dinucleotide Synthetase domain